MPPISIEGNDDNDTLFYYLMMAMPVLALSTYIYDACAFLILNDTAAGLPSSILFIFYYLHYSVTIKSKIGVTIYEILIGCMMNTGNMLYMYYYLQKHDLIQVIIYAGYLLVDSLFIMTLWTCKLMTFSRTHDRCCWLCKHIFYRFHLNPNLRLHVKVQQREFFSFVSRLEAILATLIPIFFSDHIIRTTSANFSFFILFDFFYESYHKYYTISIKICLYMFVSVVTASVVTEWLYFVKLKPTYVRISAALELSAIACCYTFIIMQFFPSHIHPKYRQT